MSQIIDALKRVHAKIFGNSSIKVSYDDDPTDGITFTNSKTNEKWTLSFHSHSDHAGDYDNVPDHYSYSTEIKDSKGKVISGTHQLSRFYETPYSGIDYKYKYRGIEYDTSDPCAPLYALANKAIKSYVKEQENIRTQAIASERKQKNAPIEKKVNDFLR